MQFSSTPGCGEGGWRMEGTDVNCSAGESVRGEISGIVGR